MAAPTLTLLNSTSISTAESTTGWTKFDLLDTDIKKEGNNGITGTFRADATDGYYDDGSAPITASGKTFRMWINTTSVPYLETLANGGMELSMYDGSTTEYITIFSSEDYFGGWFQAVIDPALFTTLTLANIQRWGLRPQYHTQAKNVDNVWVDALKYLDGYSMVGGTSGDEVTLLTIEEADRGTTTLYGYGVLTAVSGVFYCTGKIQFGTGATTHWALLDGEILVFEDKPIAAGLYSIAGVGSGSRVSIIDSVIRAAGTTDATRFAFDMSDADLLVFEMTGSFLTRAAASSFKSGQTVTGNTFNDCLQIAANGANFTGTTVKGYEGTANTSALTWTPATDPNGLLDDMTFEMGSTATHAIEFGTLSPLTMTLTGIDFSGYDTGSTPNQNDSPLHIKRTSGTVTINLSGCSGINQYGYRTDGATVVLAATVPLKVTVVDTGGIAVVGAQTAIYKVSDDTELMNEDTIAGGIASADFAYPGSDVPVYIRVRKSSTGDTRYKNAFAGGTILDTGLDVQITLTEEGVS